MKLSMKWLQDFCDCSDIPVREYCDRMTDTGSKVEGYELYGNVVGYTANKLDFDGGNKWTYSLDAINASDDENAKLKTLQYSVLISENLREIIIYVYQVDNREDTMIIYSKI